MSSTTVTSFTISVKFIYDGTLTLNGLLNGYASPPSAVNTNPPIVATAIAGSADSPMSVQIVAGAGGNYFSEQYGHMMFYGFNEKYTYNLPDGSLLTIPFIVNDENQVTSAAPTVSPGSGFEVVDWTTDSNLNMYFTVQSNN